MRDLRGALLSLARDGGLVEYRVALGAVFGLKPRIDHYGKSYFDKTDPAVGRARSSLCHAVRMLVERGDLQRSRRGFWLAHGAEVPPETPAPARVRVVHVEQTVSLVDARLNRLAGVLNSAFDEISELRRDLSMRETVETSGLAARPSFPIRAMRAGERDS